MLMPFMAIVLAFASGALAMWLLLRYGKPQPTAPRGAPAAPSRALPQIETHLVLNALNRLALSIPDEHLQDGIEALGHYLAAGPRDAAQGSGAAPGLGTALESYWRLTEWQHGKPRADWQLEGDWPQAPGQRVAVINLLQQALQSAEATPATQVQLRARPLQGASGELQVDIRLTPVGTAHPKSNTLVTWTSPAGGELHATVAVPL